jgi:hypothetical protein
MARRAFSFSAKIAKPCEESWAGMMGGSRERHCQSCDRQVHNFAAMTSSQIKELVARSDGKLCARITRRADGSVVTLDARPRASRAAQVVVSASLAIGTAGALAQAGERPAEAVLTGTVIRADGSGPLEGALVFLRADGTTLAEARTDADGAFRATVPPGVYDVEVEQGTAKTRLLAVTLQQGEQVMPPVSPASTVVVRAYQAGETVVTMGTMMVQTRYSFLYILRHPVIYLRHLSHKQ